MSGCLVVFKLKKERTFLAWLRTSLAFASIGIAITQLFRLNATLSDREGMKPQPTNAARLRQLGKPLGATFLGIAVLILIIGGRRYFESQVFLCFVMFSFFVFRFPKIKTREGRAFLFSINTPENACSFGPGDKLPQQTNWLLLVLIGAWLGGVFFSAHYSSCVCFFKKKKI